ncbi:MAG: hypothetical protein QOJ81_288 [Chloroflexota bacterium]|jgi:hypothetical protein|nr:hypothetical protein [Chloroflexota bacterium]
MRFSSLRRAIPAISASLISIVLGLISAATVFANGGGTSFP